jgi:hypothetical protein
VTQRFLEEAQIHEEVQRATQRSLEEACAQRVTMYDDVSLWRKDQCMRKYTTRCKGCWKKHVDRRSCDEHNRGKLKNMFMRN